MRRLQVPSLVRFSVDHPWLIIALAALITLLSAIPITTLQVEPDVESLLPDDTDPSEAGPASTGAESDAVADDGTVSGFDQLAILVRGDSLSTVEGLQTFDTLVTEVALTAGASSIIRPFDAITLERPSSRLQASTMATDGTVPENDAGLMEFYNRLQADPFAAGLISTADGKGLVAYLQVPKGSHYTELDAAIRETVDRYSGDLEVTLTGSIPFSAETERYLTRDALRLMALVVVTILVSYYLGFRTRRAMILPVMLVLTGTAWSLGFMGLMGWKLSMVSIVSPPLVLTLGSSYSIHILNEFYRVSLVEPDRRRRIILAVSDVSGTVVMASLSTLVGLLCLLLATMEQTRQFALATSVGVASSALLSLTLFPAFLSLQGPVKPRKLERIRSGALSRGLESLGLKLVGRRWLAALSLAGLIAAAGFLLPRVAFNTSPTSYFPQDAGIITDLKEFSSQVGGMDEIKITLTAPDGEAGYFVRQEVLQTLHSVEQKLNSYPDISHLVSLPAYLSFASQTAFGRDDNFSNRGLTLLVTRMMNSLSPDVALSNDDQSEIYLRTRIYNKAESRSIDEDDTIRITGDIRSILSEGLPEGVEYSLEGASLDFLRLSETMKRDFRVSTMAALVAIAVLCSVAFWSLRRGLLALVPLVSGIAATFVLMSLFGIPLDMTTIMMSCVAIGVGVDDAIHFLLQHRMHQGLHPENPGKAAAATLAHTGRPIVLTTLSIVLGLGWFAFAEFQPIRYFGLLIVFTLSTACLATLLILPPLLGGGRSLRRELKFEN